MKAIGVGLRHGVRVVTAALLMCGSTVSQVPNDYHQHLLSPVAAALSGGAKPFVASDLIGLMDAAGVRRAVLLSLAYQYGNPHKPPVEDEYHKVMQENDWTAAQAVLYPGRLIAFCGVDPLKEYALAEIDRCAGIPGLKRGLKLHFGNSDVNLDDPDHVARLQRVFQAADVHGMAIVVHLHANVTFHKPYGAAEAKIFLTQVMPCAPHVTIQIAHLAGSGGYDDPETDEAVQVFVDAIAMHQPAVRHLYFDISGVAGLGEWQSRKSLIAWRIHQIGAKRILYGSDGGWTGFTPEKAIAAYRELPLTAGEFHVIDRNVPPYAR
jgi:predicted TIM-barrel fold metal-dependent hydrolase